MQKTTPLTQLNRPIAENDLDNYRAVVVHDTSRTLPPLTRRLFQQQAELNASSMTHETGFGVVFLPQDRIESQLHSGPLVALPIEDTAVYFAWKTNNKGRVLQWFLDKLRQQYKD